MKGVGCAVNKKLDVKRFDTALDSAVVPVVRFSVIGK